MRAAVAVGQVDAPMPLDGSLVERRDLAHLDEHRLRGAFGIDLKLSRRRAGRNLALQQFSRRQLDLELAVGFDRGDLGPVDLDDPRIGSFESELSFRQAQDLPGQLVSILQHHLVRREQGRGKDERHNGDLDFSHALRPSLQI